MIYVAVEKLSKNYPEQPLFDNLTFGIFRGEKIALIANNGAGKSSLIKILAGQDTPDSGNVHIQEGIRVGILQQDPQYPEGQTVNDIIEDAHKEVRNVVKAYDKVLLQQDGSDQAIALLADISAKMEIMNAWDYDRDLKTFLTLFKIDDLSQKAASLSGGQRKRIALAITLSIKPDLIILDEPTNHLDIEMIEWLESHLANANVTLLMVTHDRYFLDKVCNHILELHQGKLYKHQGNYAYFLEKRAERESIFDREIDKANSMLKNELEWMRRMPQARTTKAKSRINAFYDLEDKANSRERAQELSLAVKMHRIGGKILELKRIKKAYNGTKLIENFSYNFKKGDRIGVVGPNGVGKSTLLNIMTGETPPDTGHVNTGETLVFGYYTQTGIVWKEDERMIDFIKNIAEYIPLADGTKLSASQFLQHFMFSPEMQYKPISKLSGGEKRRLHLLTVLIKNPNFLILDEPTNDLDLLTLNKLEEFLMGYNGCLLLVSHDRYFMDKLVDHLFIFEGSGQIKDYNGTYTEYRLQKSLEEKPVAKEIINLPKINKSNNKQRNELKKLEREIESLEEKKAKREVEISNPDIAYDKIETLSQEIGKIVDEINTKTERWMVLVDKV